MIKRRVSVGIIRNLQKDDVLLLIGARQVGKTTILKKLYAFLEKDRQSVFMFTLEDPALLTALNQHPENIFNYIPKNDKRLFLLLDEIQYLDNPTNFLKYMYDLYNKNIKCVVSGSSAFYLDKKFKDSLAGRKKIIELYPFSFSEFLLAKGEKVLSEKVSMHNYFEDKRKLNVLVPEYRKLLLFWREYNIYGGYPKVVLEEEAKEKKNLLLELYQSFLKKDIHEAGISNETKFYMLVKILALQAGQLVNAQELANTLDISNDTVLKYVYVLQKSYIIRLCRPFFRNVRKELTKMPKVYFLDNGYRNSLINSYEGLTDRVDNGAALENSLFTEFVKLGVTNINYWRTQDKIEVDFVVDEKYAFEAKMNKNSFYKKRYKSFVKSYPGIELRPVFYQDDEKLDILDFAS